MRRSCRRAVAVLAAAAPVVVALAPPAAAAAPTLSVVDLAVTETNAAVRKAVTIRLSARSASTVRVRVASASSTAVAPADYSPITPVTVTFLPGQTSRTVPVVVAGDTRDEYDERFKVVLSSPSRATISRGTGYVTIKDEDAPPAVTVTGTTLAEGSDGLADRAVNLTLSAVSGKPVRVGWETYAGTATSGVDYEPGGGTVTIPAGATTRPLTVSVDGDTADEPDERLYAHLTAVTNATAAVRYHRVVLTDDDLPRTPGLDPFVPATGAALSLALAGAATDDSTVRVYGAPACAGTPVATGAGSRLGTGGIGVAVPPDATTTFTADAVSPRGETSGCSNAVTYVHATPPAAAPRAPVLGAFAPATGSATVVTLFGVADDDVALRVFSAPDCAAADFVTAAAAHLMGGGIPLAVAEDATTSFSARAVAADGAASGCSNTVAYTHVRAVPPTPAAPSLDAFVPDRGTATVVTLYGTAPADTMLRVYAAADCAGDPVYTATASRLGGAGVPLPVAENGTTTFSAVTLAGETASACSNAVAYTNDLLPPAAPALTVPAGPANDNSPTVKGTAEPGSTVALYGGYTCAGEPLATGTAATFAATGLEGAAADDSVTAFSARARDAAGNLSACGPGTAYVEDSTAPAPPVVVLPDSGVGPNLLTGTVEDGAIVSVVRASEYEPHTCGAVLVAGVTPAKLATGVVVPMTPATTNRVRVLATDAAGNTTPCAAAPFRSYVDLATEHEPNDTFATAVGAVQSPNATNEHLGVIERYGARDYYRIGINETRTTFIAEISDPPNAATTCASNELSTRLELYDAQGTLVSENSTGGEGECSRIFRAELAPGWYYLLVSSSVGYDEPTPRPLAYRLTTEVIAPRATAELEPNDDAAHATWLDGRYTVDGAGQVTTAGDVDHWTFTLPAARTLTLETFDPGDGACAAGVLDLELTLYDAAGAVLATDDDSGIGLCARVSLAVPAGTYDVAVRLSPDPPGGYPGNYRLGLR